MTQRPNIIYILADDMGYGDISCLNPASKLHTPRLDQLAAEGMTFTDAHSSSAVCTPSRYSILTGRYNWRSTLKQFVTMGYAPHLIEDDRMTVATMLQQKGYHTACIGKWHLGMDFHMVDPENEIADFTQPIQHGPTTNGFDYYYGISASLDMPPYVYIENDRVTQVPDHETQGPDQPSDENPYVPRFWRKGPTAPDFRHEDVMPHITNKLMEKIDEYGDDPFFIYFPLPAPHTPILPTTSYQGKSKTNAYGDFVLMCDDIVGQVMDKLEHNGLTDNTIVVYTSDNGCSPMADFDTLAQYGHNPSYIFRGHKADIYEGGHRIPLIIRWPEGIEAGRVTDQTVCLTDFMATMADIVGYDLPDHAAEDSVSNWTLWQTDAKAPIREATVHHSIDGSFSIRQGAWKLEMCPGSGGWSAPRPGAECEGLPAVQLYNLNDDIGERINVYDQHPQIVKALTELLTAYVVNGRSTPGQPQKNTGAPFWPQLSWMNENEWIQAMEERT